MSSGSVIRLCRKVRQGFVCKCRRPIPTNSWSEPARPLQESVGNWASFNKNVCLVYLVYLVSLVQNQTNQMN